MKIVAGYICEKGAIQITSGANLNSIIVHGVYRCDSASVAQTLVNTPYTAGGFVLYRITAYDDTNWGVQIVVTHGGIWYRPNIDEKIYRDTWTQIVAGI